MSTTPSTDTKFKNDTSGKCFSGVLRRLLCAGSLQTYPSDKYISELELHKVEFNQPKNALNPEAQNSAAPGVVARLMGLDSMPDTKQRTTLDLIRSRSVTSLDFLPQFDRTQQSLHPRVRTSVSLRESPTYLNQKNHDFFLVCDKVVDSVRENGEVDMRQVKEKKKKGESRKNDRNFRGRNFVKKRENQEFSKKSCGKKESLKSFENGTIQKDYDYYRKPNFNLKGKSPLKPMNHPKVRDQLKNTKQRKKTGVQCKRVNSVASTSGAKELTTRKRSPTKVEKLKKTSPNFGHKRKDDSQELRGIHKKVDRPLITGLENDYFSKMLECIFRLTEDETKELNFSFVSSKVYNFEDFEEMCIKFGDEIFHLLLDQIVSELVCEELQCWCLV